MPKDKLSSLISSFEERSKLLRPYQEALSILQRNDHLTESLQKLSDNYMGMIDSTYTQGLFSESLAYSISNTLKLYNEMSGIQSTLDALGNSVTSLIRPDVHRQIQNITSGLATYAVDVANIAPLRDSLVDSILTIYTSWVRSQNNWMTEKKTLAALDVSGISDMISEFANLCKLERKTALLPVVPNNLISAASQIASIVTEIKPNIPLDDLFITTSVLKDFERLATKQHEMIQRAANQSEIEWRLDILNAASKYVDRQVTWNARLSDRIREADVFADIDAIEEYEYHESAINLIPTHIGYTRRPGVEITPTEGLEKSQIVTITEKGKIISDCVLKINELRLDREEERVFGLSEKVAKAFIDIGSIVCCGDEQLGVLIDGLYFIFYENIENIKLVVGEGNKEKGDALIRAEPLYECIFSIKTIRNDFRHDLDHGTASERKKNHKRVGDCYTRYCGRRPIRERDYKRLQDGLYDEIIYLLYALMDKLNSGN